MRTYTVIPESSADSAPTSGSSRPDMSGLDSGARIGPSGRGVGGREGGDGA
jgi:hypothetical protein